MRQNLSQLISERLPLPCDKPVDNQGMPLKVSQYYGENVFDYTKAKSLTSEDKKKIKEVIEGQIKLGDELAEKFAQALLEWATEKGATHFCHWFQPLTGATAEKHDSFLSFDKSGRAIEKLSAKQLAFGEPDASSFPNGGFRQTFEARGYTTWDLSSDIFIQEGINGNILYIPTGFVSFFGNALDVKTPLLRSINGLSHSLAKFCRLSGSPEVKKVYVTAGTEQEYFLVDKAFYLERPDLVMTGRTLIGALPPRNQQLSDHYFGTIPERVLAFMNDLETELYKMGIPAKTRHNEVAPGQFELAPIFKDANTAADNNHLLMNTLKAVAERHDFACLLHEKPFAQVNGSGKHINWSVADDQGNNLLEPSTEPHKNFRFLAVVAMVVEAINRHAEVLRTSIASHGNDHRLGGHEAPPSIISVFLGSTLANIFSDMISGKVSEEVITKEIGLGAAQLMSIHQDNTDRNRTSPFAFTGNKFEFRAVGSSASVGVPLAVLNGAFSEVVDETNVIFESLLEEGKDIDSALFEIAKKWYGNSERVVFNGDGYSEEWLKEAERRGLSNLKTTADALSVLKDRALTDFLVKQEIFSETEVEIYFNVFVERYNLHRDIEFSSLKDLVHRYVAPSSIKYKTDLANSIRAQKEIGIDAKTEKEILKNLNFQFDVMMSNLDNLSRGQQAHEGLPPFDYSQKVAHELMPLSEKVAESCNKIEAIIPSNYWTLPTYTEMLFLR